MKFANMNLAMASARAVVLVMAALCLGAGDAAAQFKASSVSIYIPSGIGGGYDAYARLVSRHLSKFLPGNPVMVPKNMTGAGGVVAANYMYNVAPKDGSAIALFMAGAPSQLDLFEHKPKLAAMFDKDLPPSVRGTQRLTTMTSGQSRFPIAPSIYKFGQHGKSGAWVSELLPYTAKIVDDVTFVKTLWTEAINHDPAITYIQTGNQIPGKPSAGAWMSYGLGSENQDLPTYVVLTSKFPSRSAAQALFPRLWGAGFLPSQHQGVCLRSSGDPVLFL